MTTFTALGDSITLGLGDPVPSGGWRGWAVFLAEGLPGGQLHNLATTGAQAADVERRQLPARARAAPGRRQRGGRGSTTPCGAASTRRSVHDALARTWSAPCSAAGAVVLTMRLPDPGRMLGMPGRAGPAAGPPDARPQRRSWTAWRRSSARCTLTRPRTARSTTAHVERGPAASQRARAPAASPAGSTTSSPRRGHPAGPRPDPEPTNPPPTRARRVGVDGDQGHPWVLRRSHGPGALPARDGGAGLLPRAAPGVGGAGRGGSPRGQVARAMSRA